MGNAIFSYRLKWKALNTRDVSMFLLKHWRKRKNYPFQDTTMKCVAKSSLNYHHPMIGDSPQPRRPSYPQPMLPKERGSQKYFFLRRWRGSRAHEKASCSNVTTLGVKIIQNLKSEKEDCWSYGFFFLEDCKTKNFV